MKILLLILTMCFSLSSFAECGEGDPNCSMGSDGSGTTFLGTGGCPSCTALQRSNTRLPGTKNIYRHGSSPGNDPSESSVGIGR